MSRVQHMVVVKFKPDVSNEQITETFANLARLADVIPGIDYYGGGPYASHEGLNQEYTHGFLMTFADAAARDRYLPHPEHEKVKQAILPLVDAVVAFDFEES